MLDLLKARSAKRAALAALDQYARAQPPRSSTGALHPHVIGFLAMLATLLAERRSGALRETALGFVQSSVVAQLTGACPVFIGERICLLSAMDDDEFIAGTAAAPEFLQALDDHRMATALGTTDDRDEALPALAVEIWDRHVARFSI